MKRSSKIIISISSVLGAFAITTGVAVPIIIHNLDYPNPPSVVENKTHIACIGDSITYGLGVWHDRDNKSYPAVLNNLLGDSYQTLNYGLSGRTLLSEGDRPYDKETFYPISHDVNADIYIIMLGTNDSKEHNWSKAGLSGSIYKEELKDFILSYESLDSHPTLYLMKPPKAFPVESTNKSAYDIDDTVIANYICPIISEIGEELDINVLDLYSLTKDHSDYFMDGVHPNELGNQIIANYIYQNINNA